MPKPRLLFIASSRGEKIRPALEKQFELICDYSDPELAIPRFHKWAQVKRGYRLDKVVAEFRPDLILTDHFNLTGIAAYMLSRKHEIPLVVRPRGGMWRLLPDRICSTNPVFRWVRHQSYFQTRDLVLRASRGIVPVSYFLRNQVVEQLHVSPEKIKPVHLPVDLQRFSPKASGDAFRRCHGLVDQRIILAVTNFNFHKKVWGITHFLPAVGRALDDNPGWVFVVAGDGFSFEQFRRRIERDAACNQILLTGRVGDIESAYAAADIVVHLSWRDAAPNTVLEGQAAGKPVVVNNYGGMAELMVHNGTGYVVNEPEELLERLADLMQDESMRRDLGVKGRRHVEQFHSYEEIGRWFFRVISDFMAD